MQLSYKALISLWTSALMLISPFLFIVFATALAEFLGCDLMSSVGGVCHLGDVYIADLLYGLSLLGWTLLVGVPVGLILAPTCCIWWLHCMRKERSRRPYRATHI